MADLKAFAKVAGMVALAFFCVGSVSAQSVERISPEYISAENRVKLFGSVDAELYSIGTDDLQEIGAFLAGKNEKTFCLWQEEQKIVGDSLYTHQIFLGLDDKQSKRFKKALFTFSELSPAEKARREALDDKIRTSSDKTTVSEKVIAGGEARTGRVAYTVDENGNVDWEHPIFVRAKNTYYWQFGPVVGINYSFTGEWTPYFGVELARWGKRFGGYIQGKIGWAYYPETANNPGKSYFTGGAQMGLGVKLWNNQKDDKNLWIVAMVDAMWYQTDTKRPVSDKESWVTHDGMGVGPGAAVKWRMPYFEASIGYSYTRLVGNAMADWNHNVWATITVPFSLWRNSTVAK